MSAFQGLKPKQCIPVGAKGTHNVCVCKIHGNARLKLRGLKEEFARKKIKFQTKSSDFLKGMVCPNASTECYLKSCSKCPGAKKALQDLKATMKQAKLKNVAYNQWLTTDRYFVEIAVLKKNLF